MIIDRVVAADVVTQLGAMIAAGKWPFERAPGTMRGVDFYSATDLVSALAVGAQAFKTAHGFVPSLVSPTGLCEHIFVRKYFAPLPMPSLADKLQAQEYARARLGDAVVPDVVWAGDEVGTLFTAMLPAGRFIFKANNGSGSNLILNLPGDLVSKRSEIEKRAAEWLVSRFGLAWGEWQYSTFKPKLFLERFIDLNPGSAPDDFKIFCFNGKARLIQVHMDRFVRHRCATYDPSWKHFPVAYGPYEIGQRQRPDNLDALIGAAETIAAGLEFARVDLYTDGKRIIKFGEITLTPGNALQTYADFRFDRWLGSFFAAEPARPPQ